MTELRKIKILGFISEDNSSETPLIADAKFPGAAIEILNYGIVFVSVYTDVDSAVDGLEIFQSINGADWDFSDVYTVKAGSENYSVNPHAKFLKVDYTNGGTGQGEFRLQTILKGNSKPSSHRIHDDITNDDDAELQMAIIKVQTNDEDTYKNVDAQNPFPTDGDSVYGKDLDLSRTVTSGWTGDVSDLFGDLTEGLVFNAATNPKTIIVYFRRTVITSAVGFGAESGGNFSNVKVTALLSGGAEYVVYDGSTDDTDRTSQTIQFIPLGAVGFKVEFHTADNVKLTNFVIVKLSATASTIQGIDPNGITKNIGSTESGNLKITDAENGLAIASGDVVGVSFIHKFGNTPDFDAGDGKVSIWDGADDGGVDEMQYNYSTSAIIDSISSSEVADTVDIEIQGLDSNWDLVLQTITLTGRTRKALDTNLIRVFRVKNVGNTDLVGDAYCYENTALNLGVPVDKTKIRAVINNGNNQTLMAVYTIPNGKIGYMRDWYAATAGGHKDTVNEVDLVARPFGQVFQLKHRASISVTGTSYIQHKYEEPEIFEAKTDIEMRSNTDETTSSVSAGFDIVLKDA